MQTLMLREWMQHGRGWIILMTILPAIFLVALPFGSVDLPEAMTSKVPLAVVALCVWVTMLTVATVSWLASAFQLPGLARRDQQDRSIEFWLSLPASHSESIAALLLMHAVLVPMVALVVGAAIGLVLVLPAMMLKVGGLAALMSVPWAQVLLLTAVLLLRLLPGVLLAVLWAAPLMLALMAASAWLKRWGVPAVLGVTLIGGGLLRKVYGITWPTDLLAHYVQQAKLALVAQPQALQQMAPGHDKLQALLQSGDLVAWVMSDLGVALQALLSWQFALGLAVSAAMFGLLVLRRRLN
jgi:hypothetical protein